MAIFVGREREITALVESLEGARGGDGRLVLLSGEPGIGKTRLAEELTRRAQANGFTTAWGRAWEGEGTPAYFPWRQILRRLKPILPLPPELFALVGDPRREREADPAEARFCMFDAFAELLVASSVDTPLLLVVDDLHAADLSTLDLLRFVARTIRGNARLLLVGTTRDASTVQPLLAQIAREATTLPLARLPREAVASWVAHDAPELSSHVDRLVSVSEGNPLFVGELLASARKRPEHRWSTTHELPLGVREAIRTHIATLSDGARNVLARAAVFGREFPAGAVGQHTSAQIEEAIQAGVVVPVTDGGAMAYRFTHVLIRDELYAALSPARRAELHREVAAHEDDPAVAAPHWLAGGRAEDAATVFATVTAAMRDALARFAFADAALIGEKALGTQTFAPREACELRVSIAEAWVLGGKPAAARATAAEAAKEAALLGDAELHARAALAHATEVVLAPGRDEAAVSLLASAREKLNASDSALRARVMGRLALAMLPAPPEEHARALALGRDAVAMARRLGDEETQFTVLALTRRSPSETDAPATRFAENAETIALGKKLGRTHEIASLFAWQVAAHIELGDIDGATSELDAMETALASYAQPHYRYQVPLVRALLADIEGRFAEADALSRDVLRYCEEHEIVPGIILALVQRIGFMYTRGGPIDSWPEVEPLAKRLFGGGPLSEIYRCMYDAPYGRVEDVRRSLALTNGIPLEALPDGAGLATPCAVAGIVEQAQRFYDFGERQKAALGPWQFGPGRVTSMGPRALTLGRLAMLLGRRHDAIRHFERALAFVERLRSRPFITQARQELARARAGSSPAPAPSPSATTELALERDGETWTLAGGDKPLVLKDTKGVAYLAALLASPGREIHVLELAGQHREGDAGAVLDERAKREYRERAESLREELEEATRNADTGRAERIREEIDSLAHELTRAVGLGGRDRRAVSPSERARINVQRRIRDVIARVRVLDAALGEHLQVSVRTGMFCVYLPVARR